MAIGKKKRFSVFERDGFCCQYCGLTPPDVVLEVDHMVSKKDGGSDDLLNLTTACFDCNRGKSKKSIYNPKKSKVNLKREIKNLEEKKGQLESYYLFIQRKKELKNKELEVFENHWKRASGNRFTFNEHGLKSIARLKEIYPAVLIFEAMDISWGREDIHDNDKFRFMCGVLKNLLLKKTDPEKAKRKEEINKNIQKFYNLWNSQRKGGGYINYKTKELIEEFFSRLPSKEAWIILNGFLEETFINKRPNYSLYLHEKIQDYLINKNEA